MATNNSPCYLNTSTLTAPAPKFVSQGLAQPPPLIQDLVLVNLGYALLFLALLFLPHQLSSGVCSHLCQKRWDNVTFISMMHLQSLEIKLQI